MSDVQRVARVILREVPVAHLSTTMSKLRRPGGEAAFGDGCGGGCTGGNSCFDRFGHSEIGPDVFRKALGSQRDLQAALQAEVRKSVANI